MQMQNYENILLVLPGCFSQINTMQSRHWCFTLNNWTQEDDDRLKNLGEAVTYIVYGYEVGDNGTPHLQGYVVFPTIKRLNQVKEAIGDRAHCEVKRGSPSQAADYCKKAGIFYENGTAPSGGRGCSMFDAFVKWIVSRKDADLPLPSDREIAREYPALWLRHERRLRDLATHLYPCPELIGENAALRDWQQALEDVLTVAPPDNRSILFYVDAEGGKGKTWFQRYMLSKYPDLTQVLSSGKRDDIAHAVDETKKVFMFNVPRGGMEYLQYTILEQLKDQMLFSPKYDSKTKILPTCPHVVVFCNEHPDETKMSTDRYVIHRF